jgi:hypothetical protein
VLTADGEGGTSWEAGGGSSPYTYTGNGSPQGVQAAAAIGNTYLDSTNGASYLATATGTDGWVLVAGIGQGTDSGVFSNVGVAELQDGNGGSFLVGGDAAMQPAATGETASVNNYQGEAGVTVSDDGSGNVTLSFYRLATPVVQAAAVTPPSGGAVVDSESRTAIDALITALTNLGLLAS